MAEATTSPVDASRRERALDAILCSALAQGSRLLGDVIGSSGLIGLWANTELVAEGPNGLIRSSKARAQEDAVKEALRRVSTGGSEQPADVLSALQDLEGHLTGLMDGRGADVVLLSGMVNGVAPLRLDERATLDASPFDLFEIVAEQHLVPDCTGWRVYVVGTPQNAVGPMDGALARKLRDFWSLFFSRCGGHLLLYASELTSFPLPDQPLAPPRAPVAVVKDPVAGTVVKLPGSVLFDTASAEVRSDADAALMEALTVVQAHGGQLIEVAGFTDSVGLAHVNRELSESRAGAVARWLVAHGVAPTRLRTVGYGPDRPIGDNATPEGRQQNRRVEVSFVG